MNKYTAFCRAVDGGGTTWIETVEAGDAESASGLAVIACAADWGTDVDEVECFAMAAGDVDILFWHDVEG